MNTRKSRTDESGLFKPRLFLSAGVVALACMGAGHPVEAGSGRCRNSSPPGQCCHVDHCHTRGSAASTTRAAPSSPATAALHAAPSAPTPSHGDDLFYTDPVQASKVFGGKYGPATAQPAPMARVAVPAQVVIADPEPFGFRVDSPFRREWAHQVDGMTVFPPGVRPANPLTHPSEP